VLRNATVSSLSFWYSSFLCSLSEITVAFMRLPSLRLRKIFGTAEMRKYLKLVHIKVVTWHGVIADTHG